MNTGNIRSCHVTSRKSAAPGVTKLVRFLMLMLAILGLACTAKLSQDALLAHRAAPLPLISERVSRKNVELTVAPSVTVRGWYFSTPGSQRTILFFHGNGAGIASSFWALYWFAEEFDANVLALDARGFGFSDGAASIDDIVGDSLRIYDYATKEFGFRDRPPIIIGQSMGAASAIHAAANRVVAALVLLSPLGSYEDVVAAANASTPWYVHVEADETLRCLRTSPLRDLPNARSPTLIVHGAQDRLATASVIRRVHDASGASFRKVCEVPGGHEDVHATNQRVRSCIDEFKAALASAVVRDAAR
jgi:pimeloyl-ACP methyl ester carboxylesterase